MSRAQRLTFVAIAAAIAVVAVIVLAGGGGETEPTSKSAQKPTPTATATATATAKPAPLLEAGDVKALTATQGETVTFRVRSDEKDEVHVHGYDLKKDVEPGKTRTLSFKADLTGIFEVELEDAKTEIG